MTDYPIDSETHGEDSGEPLSPRESKPTRKPSATLSDSLRASVDASAPLHILGDDLYEEVLNTLFKSKNGRQESQTRGMLYNPNVTPALPFLFRDRRSRAWYVFQSISGFTFPCDLSQPERDRLNRGFERGWADGSLSFLAAVSLSDCEGYRKRL
jgi:hypothetical protein